MTHEPFILHGTPLVPLAFGAMLMGTRTPEDEARRILDHVVDHVTPRFAAADGTPARAMVDTADCYCWWERRGETGGHSEGVVGRWLADRGTRDQVYLATKGTATLTDVLAAWPDPAGAPDWSVARRSFVGASPDVLRASLAGSLERLGVDAVDLYYVHVDDRSIPLADSAGALASFVADGRIGGYGWSNVPAWRLAELRAVTREHGWPGPVALQEEHSYLRPAAGTDSVSIVGPEHLELLRDWPELSLVAYSPVLKGAYSDRSRRGPGSWLSGAYRGEDTTARLAAVDAVADRLGATGNQVALAWLLAQESPRRLPLIGARTFDQYLECVEALDVDLDADALAELEAAGA